MTKVSIGSHDKPKFNIGDIVTYNLAVFMVLEKSVFSAFHGTITINSDL